MPTNTPTLTIDPRRAGEYITGIMTRAVDPETKKTRTADIGELDSKSLNHWLRIAMESDPSIAAGLFQQVLGHGAPPSCGSPKPKGPTEAELAMGRVREKMLSKANSGDQLVLELASQAMMRIIDVLTVLDEPFTPHGVSMVAALATEQATRTNTSRKMWSQYREDESQDNVQLFIDALEQKGNG